MNSRLLLGFLSLLPLRTLTAQTASQLVAEGVALKEKHQLEAALVKFESALAKDPNNVEALWNASRMVTNIGGRKLNKDEKMAAYKRGEQLALRAMALDSNHCEVRLAYIVSIGLMSEIAGSPRERLKDAGRIRHQAEQILKIDSAFTLGYFVLAKYHHELSKLNWLERLAIDLLFGGMPKGVSWEIAEKYFRRCVADDPENILFLYNLAVLRHDRNDDKESKALLEKALRLPLREPDDQERKDKAKRLLDEIS
jgi:tetratricopeptide (TPR) repeat protein